MTIFLLVCIFVTSCTKGEFTMQSVDQSVILYDQVSDVHSYESVKELLNSNIKLEDFFQQLNISQFKQDECGQYTILKTSHGDFVIFYAENTLYAKDATFQEIKFSQENNKVALLELQQGATLSDVRAADPDGDYNYLLHYSSESIPLSYHYFRDGSCFCIVYKDSIVVDILCFTI